MPARVETKPDRRTARAVDAGFSPALLSGILLMVGVTLIAYWPAIRSGFIWDDNDMLTNNHLVLAPDGLWRIWFKAEFVDYFPLTMSSLWIEWRLWGLNATGYHVTNVLLHALSSIVLWRVLKRLNIPAAFWAALLFALHPVNVESVAWITERKNTLSMFFFALAALFFLRSEPELPAAKTPSQKWYFASVVAFTLSLLAKTSGVMLPFVLLSIAWWRNGRVHRRDMVRSLPFFGVALALGLLTLWFQYTKAISETAVNTNTFAQRLAGAGWAVWFYVWKALVPVNLTFVYPRWEIDAANPLVYLPGIAVMAALIGLWFAERRIGRGPVLAGLYFVLMLFPVLGFFNIYFQRYSFVADHWQYFSLLSATTLIAATTTRLLKQNTTVALSVVAVALAVLTWRQCGIYQSQETLWRDTLKKNPRCWMAESNWGLYLAGLNRETEAIPHYEAALRIKADDDGSLYNVGVALLHTGKASEAMAKFYDALRINPKHRLALNNLAWIRATSPDLTLRNGDEALQLANRAVEATKSTDEFSFDTLAAASAEAGRFDQAVKAESRAIELATQKGFLDSVQDMSKRLQLYQARQPFREGQ